MGCHPSHWSIFFKMVIAPATSILIIPELIINQQGQQPLLTWVPTASPKRRSFAILGGFEWKSSSMTLTPSGAQERTTKFMVFFARHVMVMTTEGWEKDIGWIPHESWFGLIWCNPPNSWCNPPNSLLLAYWSCCQAWAPYHHQLCKGTGHVTWSMRGLHEIWWFQHVSSCGPPPGPSRSSFWMT